MKWLAIWLLLTAVYLAALALCHPLTGQPLFTSVDLVDLLLIPAAQVAALAAVAATARLRRKR
ncbi:MAG TPA: hypothetical protein VJA16_18100 [Thermoanaerobaculia bacterium]